MYYKIERYKTADGKEHENIDYMIKHVESLLGQEIEKLLEKDFNKLPHMVKVQILNSLTDLKTAEKMQAIYNKILNYGNE